MFFLINCPLPLNASKAVCGLIPICSNSGFTFGLSINFKTESYIFLVCVCCAFDKLLSSVKVSAPTSAATVTVFYG